MKLKNLALMLSLLASPSLLLAGKLRIVTTTQDLASIAEEIGRDNVEVISMAKGYQDPHFVDAKPSFLLKLGKADLLMIVGLELEVGWLPPLLTNGRNSRILPGQAGFLDASAGCDILQKPSGPIDRSMGDIHPEGNPHYWLDPENGRIIARYICAKLAELDPAHQKDYRDNLERFEARLSEKEKEWRFLAESFNGVKVITYHNSFPNFAKAFGVQIVNHVEPKPGIPPSPSHVQELIEQIRSEKIPLLLIEPYFDAKLPMKIAEETGAKLLIFPPSVGGDPHVKTYFDLFDYDLKLIHGALTPGGVPR